MYKLRSVLVLLFFTFGISAYAQDRSKYDELDSLVRYYQNLDIDKAFTYQKDAIQQAILLEDSALIIDANVRLTYLYGTQGNHQAAFERWEAAFPYARDKYDTVRIYRGKGIAYDRMGKSDEALEYLLKAISLLLKTDVDLQARLLNDIGLLYRRIDEPIKALEHFNKILVLKHDDDKDFGTLLNIGLVHLDLDQYDSAIIYFNRSYDRMDKENQLRAVGFYFNNMGSTLSDMGKPKEALPYAERAIEIKKRTGHTASLASSYNLLSSIYLLLKEYEKAEKYAGLSLNLLDSSNINKTKVNSLEYLIEAKVRQSDTTQLMSHIYQAIELKKAMYSQEKAQAFSEMATKYDLSKKENELLQKNLDLQKASGEIEKQSLFRNALIGVLLLFVIIIVLIVFSQRRKIRDNKLLMLKNEEIESRNEQIRKMEAYKSRFFANISHEFRTPLTLLLGPIDEIREKVNDSQSHLYLDLMKKNARRLLGQVNQLLDLSKLDAGQLKLHVVHDDIISFIKGVTMCFESLAASRHIELRFSAHQDTINTYFDKDCLEKVIVNLLSNAFKFSNEGDQVLVEITNSEKSGDHITIKVSDTGVGIDTNEHEQIFERYHHTESDMQASSGIGLALVKELVSSHNGTIEVSSTKGQGSSFTITLPLGKAQWKDISVFETVDANAIQSDPDYEETLIVNDNKQSVITDKKTVLIIEDNPDVRLFIREALKEEVHIIEAKNGEAGIAKGEELIPDLIITDLMMSGLDGHEVVKQLKQSEKTSHIPVIMLTARTDMESKLKGLENEADDFITKPFERKELLSRILNLIKGREKLKTQFNDALIIKPSEIEISSVDKILIEKLLAAIEEHIDDNTFGVEELAEVASMSRSQLHRKLQALIGQAPSMLIRSIRLTRAMDLLKNNAGSVSEVAYMTGFSSPNYFSKCFSDQFGFPPGEVRKEAV